MQFQFIFSSFRTIRGRSPKGALTGYLSDLHRSFSALCRVCFCPLPSSEMWQRSKNLILHFGVLSSNLPASLPDPQWRCPKHPFLACCEALGRGSRAWDRRCSTKNGIPICPRAKLSFSLISLFSAFKNSSTTIQKLGHKYGGREGFPESMHKLSIEEAPLGRCSGCL